jgi:hypothetical protein
MAKESPDELNISLILVDQNFSNCLPESVTVQPVDW